MGLFGADTRPITVIDLGSHQVRVLVANLFDDGEIEMLGFGQRKSMGMSEGLILNPRQVEQSLSDAVASADNLAGTNTTRAYVGVNHKLVRSLTVRLEQNLNSQAVTPAMCQALQSTALEQANARLPKDMQWANLHVIPLGYCIDGSEPTDFPDGIYGNKLQAEFHIVATPLMVIQNLKECLSRTGIEVERFVLSPYAAALGTLSPAHHEYGGTLVDLGGDITSLAIFKGWKLRQTAVLPIGANDITRDVAQHFGFNPERAEKLKVTHGNLAATLSAPNFEAAANLFSAKEIEHIELNPIVEARMREILMAVREILNRPSLSRDLSQSLIFTGGGAQLKGLTAYAEALFHDKKVQVSLARAVSGMPEAVHHTGFATVMGLLHYAGKISSQKRRRAGFFRYTGVDSQALPVVRRLFGK